MNKLPIGTKLKFKTTGTDEASYFGKIIGYGNDTYSFYYIEYNSSTDPTKMRATWTENVLEKWDLYNNICYPDE